MDKPIMWLAHFVGWVRTSCVKSSIFCSGNAQELIFSWEILSELAGWPKIESQQQVDRIHLQMSEKWVSAPISLFSPFPASRQSPLISSDCTPILLQKSHMSLPGSGILECFFPSLEFNLQCMRVCLCWCWCLSIWCWCLPSCLILKAAGWITTFVIFLAWASPSKNAEWNN